MGIHGANRATLYAKGGGLMPVISFREEWIDKLLSGAKQQTTRPQTDRIKVGDVVHVYNQQRMRIVDKPTRKMTPVGVEMIHQKRAIRYDKRTYPPVHPDTWIRERYYAHFLGKIEITEVFDINPSKMNWQELEAWAWADDFKDFATARCWFEIRHGAQWMKKTWTVIRWNGWQERYFEPGE